MTGREGTVRDGPGKRVLRFLQSQDIAVIDRALERVGPFGEVHLVIENGRLRLIRILNSEPVTRASSSSQNSKR